MTPTLTAESVGDTHEYLADARPEWRSSLEEIQNLGGPWDCSTCSRKSLLIYRCSICGAPMHDE